MHDATQDYLNGLVRPLYEKDEEKQKELQTTFFTVTHPQTLATFERKLIANSSQNFLVGDRMTTADFQLFGLLQNIAFNEHNPQASILAATFEPFPVLKAYMEYHINNTFKEYLASRPASPI